MMWDLSGGNAAPGMPVPHPSSSSLSVPHKPHHHGRPLSAPGPPSPGWSVSRAHTPVPVPVPNSFLNSESGAYVYEPTPRGLLTPSHGHRHHHHHHQHHHHAPPPPPQPQPRRHHRPPPSPHVQFVPPQPQPPRRHHHAHTPSAPVIKLPIVLHPKFRPPPAIVHTPHFMYSKCTGRRRALCIGINYQGQSHELRGCINDAKHVFSFLVRRGYHPEDIVVLTDDSPNPRGRPTRQNIIDAMHWLVQGARTHDALFFHYSGHGGQTPDLDGDEPDGYDETIYPVDYKRTGHIVDDEMHNIMVKPLPEGCRLTAVFDSCHSGTVLDLPYMYDHHGRLKGVQVTGRALVRKTTHADVISLSGCKDGQTSADTFADGMAVGAASHAFIKAFEMHPNQSYREIMRNIRVILNPKFSQKPQLGSSHPIDTGLKFIM
ncbi:caspase domain-containing protein [Roridomyces roridus]|uniref:Caspase domain-containing protein n=1 Tax=Roridomyces roridus TaxID=1738132 RepID=A0AAD7F8I9_9AGAR|nr:caspase domain-containing protein [Roridomyces roridus]